MTEHNFAGASIPVEEEDTLLSDLEAELKRRVQKDLLYLTVPARPRMSLIFDPTIDFEDYQAWVKKAKDSKKDDGPNPLKLAFTVLSHTTRGMQMDGQEKTTAKGESLPLTSPHVHKLAGVPIGSTTAAIRWIYGSDGHIIQAMHKIVEAAGYSVDGDVEEADPTRS